MRRWVMGDIHGELNYLQEVFDKSGFDFEKDELIQVGDICDRGQYSFECVELLKKCKNLILIQGNHDLWFKKYLVDYYLDPSWYQQGGKETLESYTRHKKNFDYHKDFYFSQIPYYIDGSNRCFVHGGWDRKYKISQCDETSLCWDREFVEQMMSCSPGTKLKTKDNFTDVFIGHTPTIYWYKNESKTLGGLLVDIGQKMPITEPIIRGGVINVDTGSGKGGVLTIMDIETKEYFQSTHP